MTKVIENCEAGNVKDIDQPKKNKAIENLRKVTDLAPRQTEPVIGREEEIRRIMEILSRRTKNNQS